MFRANNTFLHTGLVIDVNGFPIIDMDGEPSYMTAVEQPCSVISLDLVLDRSSVRADSSASRGRAQEIGGSAMILVSPTLTILKQDIAEIQGELFEVIAVWPRTRVRGGVHHKEIVLRRAKPV